MTDTSKSWDIGRLLHEVISPLTVPASVASPVLGKYRLIREIAQGAMGVVMEAEDVGLKRRVAVKLLRDLPGQSDVVRLRFKREALAAARLSHPNVVRVLDADQEGERTYLVMELVEGGRSLRDVIGERKHELRAMLQMIEKSARGVAAAHEAGIVHRDVKPANILITSEGEPKVGDFGLAHWLDSDTALTKSGIPMGTPMYMAPEQVEGGRGTISPATDVYALGAILYEVLTGRPPHTGENTAEIYGKILTQDPIPPRRISTKVHSELETICLKALDHDSGRRYANAGEFADDLRRHLEGESIFARPAGAMTVGIKWARRHRVASVAMGVGLAGLLMVVAVISWNLKQERRKVDEWVASGTAAWEAHLSSKTAVERIRREAVEIEAGMDPHASGDRRQKLWEKQDELRRGEVESSRSRGRAEAAFRSALGIDSGDARARKGLATIYTAGFEQAEERGDAQEMENCALLVQLYDDELSRRLAQPGTLILDSDPPGAEAELLRYDEMIDGRLQAKPLRALGACPVDRTELAAGSWLVLLHHPGYRDVRYPVFIERGKTHEARVRLYQEEEIGKKFVYVPEGPFILGGEHASSPRRTGRTGGFFICAYEVTFGEYLEFLNGLAAGKGADYAQLRAPRSSLTGNYWAVISPGTGRFSCSVDEDVAVTGISWNAALEYCEWRTESSRNEAGLGRCRLPTGEEWTKAASGADGRPFPWGLRFDWSHARGNRSPGPDVLIPRVGGFPRDESPYGVRDMAGNASEWCDSDFERMPGQKVCLGASVAAEIPEFFRLGRRWGMDPSNYVNYLGFRIVRDAPTR